MAAAFLCYTAMYAVRKSFLAGQYAGGPVHGMDLKVVLIISQVLGYMISKFFGIQIIAELDHKKRTRALLSLVGFGIVMLFFFGILPRPWKPVALFLNGLPLGMVFGILLSYLEGRRNTELLTAALSATFIFSTGFVKTTGLWLLRNQNVPEFFMPFTTALLFVPALVIALWMLEHAKAPSKEDEALRTKRIPMNREKRTSFFLKYGLGFSFLVLVYIFLTVLRDFRDNFIVEFWTELGYGEQPDLLTLTEVPVAIIVLAIAAAMVFIISNRKAFRVGMILTAISGLFIFSTTLLFKQGLISSINWMIIFGIGVYLPYILFHCVIFERLLAYIRFSGTVGFLFYIADASGYAGSVTILLLKELGNFEVTWVEFFIQLNLFAPLAISLLSLLSIWAIDYEHRKYASVGPANTN